MQLSEFKKVLQNLPQLSFNLPDGTAIPSHFMLQKLGLLLSIS